jgi:hypothetical protein
MLGQFATLSASLFREMMEEGNTIVHGSTEALDQSDIDKMF